MPSIYGNRVKELRQLKGIHTQKALADLVGVPQPYICALEKGRVGNLDLLVRVADQLDCATDFLLGRGPFRSAESEDDLRHAASRMAFDCFSERLDVTPTQRERCARVLGYRDAPLTSDGWKSLAEMVDLAIGSPPPRLEVVKA